MNKSVQQLLDEQMCKPGYTWNDTLKRCLGYGGGAGEIPLPAPQVPDTGNPETEPGVKPKKGKKPGAGPARNQSRTSATGMKQTGTAMGMSMSIK